MSKSKRKAAAGSSTATTARAARPKKPTLKAWAEERGVNLSMIPKAAKASIAAARKTLDKSSDPKLAEKVAAAKAKYEKLYAAQTGTAGAMAALEKAKEACEASARALGVPVFQPKPAPTSETSTGGEPTSNGAVLSTEPAGAGAS